MIVLMLDDDKNRARALRRKLSGVSWRWVTTARQAITAIESQDIGVLFLDHDLDPSWGLDAQFRDSGCGMGVVEWAERNPHHPRFTAIQHIIVHSLAETAPEQMVRRLRKIHPSIVKGPGCWADREVPLMRRALLN